MKKMLEQSALIECKCCGYYLDKKKSAAGKIRMQIVTRKYEREKVFGTETVSEKPKPSTMC